MKFKIVTTLIILIVLLGFLYLRFAREVGLPMLYPTEATYDFSLPTPPPLHPPTAAPENFEVAAWIPDWDMRNGIASVTAAGSNITSVSPVWYYLNDGGGVDTKRIRIEELKAAIAGKGIKLLPSIASFSADQLRLILETDEKIQAHVDFLVSEVDTYGYDGIDIDYESSYFQDQPKFIYFMQLLYEALDAKGKTVSIAVISNWTETDIFRTLRQTRAAQDWGEISQYANEVRLMAYDMTGYTSTYPGPVSPLDWLDAILRYAVTHIPREKLILGLPLYGYDGWSNNPVIPEPYLGLFANPGADKGQADAVTETSLGLARQHLVSNKLEQHSQEQLLIYNYEDKDYFIFYQSREATQKRIDLAKAYRIKGVAYWRMGGEDTGIYSLR